VRVGLHWWGAFAVVGLVLAASSAAGADQLAVGESGRAFVVSPSAVDRSVGAASVRLRSAAPGGRFGPWRTVLRAGRDERVMDAGVAADGSGVAVLEGGTTVRMLTFGGRLVGSARGDFAAAAVAPTGAAIVVTFHHRSDRRWRLEASVRDTGAAAFGRSEPLTGFRRRACCTSVSAAIGAHGDAVVTWSSTARPSVWAAARGRGGRFGRAQRLAASAADAPRAFVGAGGAAAVTYSTQHVPLRRSDGLQLHRAMSGSRFGPAEHVNPGGGVTAGDVAVTPSGALTVVWIGEARVHVSRAAANGPLALTAEVGSNVSARGLAVDSDDAGRTVVAWSERAGRGERATASTSPATGAPFGPPAALGRAWRAAEPLLARLIPTGGALVLWTGNRYRGPAARRTTLAVTRLP
jgi:uncharacterized protein (DUF2237 family)